MLQMMIRTLLPTTMIVVTIATVIAGANHALVMILTMGAQLRSLPSKTTFLCSFS